MRWPRPLASRAALAAALVAAPLLLDGCGKKGPPRPPVRPAASPAAAVSPTPIGPPSVP